LLPKAIDIKNFYVLAMDMALPAQSGHRPVQVIRIAWPGNAAGGGIEAGAVCTGLLAADKPKPGFFGIHERHACYVRVCSGATTGARHMGTPLGLMEDLKRILKEQI